MLLNKAKSCAVGPFVYGFIDLFSGLEDSRNWSLNPDENRGIISTVQSHPLDTSRILHEKPDKNLKRSEDHAREEVALPSPIAKLNTLQGDNVDDTSISSSDSSNSIGDVESGFIQNEKKVRGDLSVFILISPCFSEMLGLRIILYMVTDEMSTTNQMLVLYI